MKKTSKTVLRQLYLEGQRERAHEPALDIEIKKRIQNDIARKKRARALYAKGQVSTGADLYYMAMLFHHGLGITDAHTAQRFAKISMEKGFKKARWLYAAATDRLLMKQKKPQKYGTQFFKKSSKHPWVLYKTDPHISDKERTLYTVQSLDKTKKDLERMNKK